jgi:oxalate decarboxylase
MPPPFTGYPPPPVFGPPPPLLSGPTLPSFRHDFGADPVQHYDGGWVREATVAQFPVSDTLSGALLQLEPGGLRELHWHPGAAEWAYILDGHVRITAIDPDNRSEVVDFGPGDVWYFPRGHGHSLQGIGDKPCRFLLVFDNGWFSEFTIADWFANTPIEVLAKNFGVPASALAGLPRKELFITQGKVPGPLPSDPLPDSIAASVLSHRYRLDAQQPEVFPGGTMKTVSMNEFPISTTMTGALLRIKPGGLRELHWHPNAAEWQYYNRGKGRMTVFGGAGRARTDDFAAGDVGYVPLGFGHSIENTGDEELEVVLVLNSGVYQSISVTAWLAANTPELLATNLKLDPGVFAGFPKSPAIIAG